MLDQVIKELSARAELRHEPNVRFGGYDFVELNDVRMPQLSMMMDLSRQQRRGFVSRYLLDGNSHRGQPVQAQADGAIGALRDDSTQRVVADDFELWRKQSLAQLIVSVVELENRTLVRDG